MQIVIDIPEQIYKELIQTAIIVTEVYPSTIERALAEGIVLPKGHEALKDAGMIKRFLYSSARFWGTWNLGKHRIFEAIDNVEAVIEADKEVDDDSGD